MLKRDIKGRFIKEEEGFKIDITLINFSRLIFWGLLLLLISPWIFIISNQITDLEKNR